MAIMVLLLGIVLILDDFLSSFLYVRYQGTNN